MKRCLQTGCMYLILLVSCSKDKQQEVQLRIENATAQNIADVLTGTNNFGNIGAGAVTNYKLCKNIVNQQTVSSFTIAGTTIYPFAIAIDPPLFPTPSPEYLNGGKYTITVYFDSVNAMNYRTKFKKD